MARSTTNVWARERRIGQNPVRQLLVRECDSVEVDQGNDGSLSIRSPYGAWPARRGSTIGPDEPLTANLPMLDSDRGPIHWRGSREPLPPEQVLASFDAAIGFTPHDRPRSLRRPQIAALHSIVGYQSSGLPEPGIVVMPTGTGKTETMLAWLIAQRPTKVLVIVPSAALRDQIASKFETLGILQQEAIVSPQALRPVVGRLEKRVADVDDARALVAACNVVVATPQAIHVNDGPIREAFYEGFTHLLVDEAHHAPATTWSEIIRAFAGRPTLLFTATPYRRDGRTLPGRVIFRFPLREAQRENYFSRIDFTAVLDLDDDDESLALAALERLRSDLATGYQHVLLARVATKSRAEEIHACTAAWPANSSRRCSMTPGRSALAAALARAQFGDRIDAESAGVDPQSAPSEVTIASLAELGIDDSHHIPTGLTPERVAAADIVVAMKPGLSIPQVDGVPIQLCRDRRQGHGHPTTSLTKRLTLMCGCFRVVS